MAGFVDKVVGLYHFVSDRAPKSSPLVDPKPRTVNPWCRSDQALISKVMAGEDIRASVDKSLALLGCIEQARDFVRCRVRLYSSRSASTYPFWW